jgi:tetratricopeptide (TPR) repeat protein
VVGHQFSGRIVAASLAIASEEADLLLEEARRSRLVVADESGGDFHFSHALVRELLYERLGAARRAELHERIGAAIEHAIRLKDVKAHAAELSHHYSQSSSPTAAAKTVDFATLAGAHAIKALAYEDAVTHYGRALAALDRVDLHDRRRRLDLLLALGDACNRTGDRARARAQFERAADLARTLDDAERLAAAALGLGAGFGCYSFIYRPDPVTTRLLEEADAALDDESGAAKVQVLARLSIERYHAGRAEESAELSARAVQLGDLLDDPAARLAALHSRQWSLLDPAQLPELLTTTSEVLMLAVTLGDREMEFRARNFRIRSLLSLGDIAGVDREIEESARLARELRQPFYEWQLLVSRAMRALLSGRVEEGEQLAQAALATGTRAGRAEEALFVFTPAAYVMLWMRGRLGEIESAVRARAAEQNPAQRRVTEAGLAWQLAETGRTDDARELFERVATNDFADVPRHSNWLYTFVPAALTAYLLRDVKRASAIRRLLLPYKELIPTSGAGSACMPPVRMLLGALATTLGLYDEASEHFELGLAAAARSARNPSSPSRFSTGPRCCWTATRPATGSRRWHTGRRRLRSRSDSGCRSFPSARWA